MHRMRILAWMVFCYTLGVTMDPRGGWNIPRRAHNRLVRFDWEHPPDTIREA